MFDDEDVTRLQPLPAPSQGCKQLFAYRCTGDDFIRVSNRYESNLGDFARLCHRFWAGLRRLWLYRIRIRCEQVRRQVPTSCQTLRASFPRKKQKLPQVRRIVHVHGDPWQVQNDAGFASSLGGRVMRLEAVIPEAKRKQVGRSAKS